MELGKPSGLLLAEHVSHVEEEGRLLEKCFPFVFQKYESTIGKDLKRRLNVACRFHDEGKKYWKWQKACKADYQAYLEWKAQNNNGSFQDYEKAENGKVGLNLMALGGETKFRHEIQSLIDVKKISLPIQVAIAAHHSKLCEVHESRWSSPEYKGKGIEFWEIFQHLNKNGFIRLGADFEKALNYHYEYAAARILLQLADRRASAKEGGATLPDYQRFNYTFDSSWSKRPVQEIAEENWKDDLLLIRAPTGAGKTDAALLWAKKQIENGKADRLIIAMPTRFTSNALAISTAASLSKSGLYHSTSWFKLLQKVNAGELAKDIARKEQEFARLLLHPTIVCTIDHLLMSLTLSREDHHTINFHLANSCLVIDEADFYDDFTQANILVLLEACRVWKVPVMIMSASLPQSCLKQYQTLGFQIDEIKEDRSNYDKPRCEISSIQPYNQIEDLGGLLQRCIDRKCAIIYANTVDRAMEYYEWFAKKGIKPILYHARFTEPDKVKKEKLLIEQLGKDAWQKGEAKGIAIMTQIGEMSVNISANIMISDLCPIDRLVQRAGRLCRFNPERLGELHVVIPHKNEKIHPAPYGTYLMKERAWEISPALSESLKLLKTGSYSAKQWVELINEVYRESQSFSTKAVDNARMLKDLFVKSWLIGSLEMPTEDDENTTFWKSRDIGNSVSVFVKYPERQDFNNYRDFLEYKNDVIVTIPGYLVDAALKKDKTLHMLEIRIAQNKKSEKIYYAMDGTYGDNLGLQLKKKPDVGFQLI